MHELLTPRTKKSTESSLQGSQKPGPEDLKNCCKMLQRCRQMPNAAKMLPETWYKIYVKPWHPELEMVGTCLLSKVI